VAVLNRVHWPRAILASITSAGCSLALDTASLQSSAGNHADAASDAQSMETGDAIDDRPVCPEPGPDPCAQCQAAMCCADSTACAHEVRCNLAMVALQQCRRDARLADNSRAALGACNTSFVQNGGSQATTVLGCMAMKCQSACGA
jgi:hypothetical protein